MVNRIWDLKILIAAAGVLVMPQLAFGNSLTLTSQGIADGFTLSTFATTNPGNIGCCGGPFGVAMTSNGNVLVNTGSGAAYIFADADGQTTGSALFTRVSTSGTSAAAIAGGQTYGSQSGHYVEFNPNGTVNHVLTGVTAFTDLGMWGNPVNGHIIAQSGSGLIDIDPLANGGQGSFRVINGGVFGDGVTVSADGKTAYVEVGGEIVGYNIATGAAIFVSGGFAALSGPDGSGIISSLNNLDGDIIVNFNGNGFNTGGIGLLNPSTDAFTVIATGGTRGDYVAPDTKNGTLFLDYSDTVERLSCGKNCSIGGSVTPTGSTVPEPETLTLMGTGLTLLAAMLRRTRLLGS
jgi:PEP-CTERM motif